MTGPAALLGSALPYLDWAAVAVFACSGALLAAAKKQTLVTLIFFAVVTGVGGGTARDLLIGAPVFWVHENGTLLRLDLVERSIKNAAWAAGKHAAASSKRRWSCSG
jgi:uncharacterized membrane protein YeiH